MLPFPRLPHILIAGLTGSGKSGVLNALLYALSVFANVAIVGIDLKKVEFQPWRDRLTVLSTDGGTVDQVLGRLRGEIERREQLLVDEGLRSWRGDLGPWLVFMIDEFAELSVADLNRLIEATQAVKNTESDKALTIMMRAARHSLGLRSAIMESFARKCRALGVVVIIATQYPTADVVDTQVRSQFEIRFMCRVGSKEQIKVSLGDGMEDHVSVGDISPHQRGAFVVAGLETKTFVARASKIEDHHVADQVAATAHLRVPEEILFPNNPPPPTGLVPAPIPPNGPTSSGLLVPGQSAGVPLDSLIGGQG